jgi:hypothetical protein
LVLSASICVANLAGALGRNVRGEYVRLKGIRGSLNAAHTDAGGRAGDADHVVWLMMLAQKGDWLFIQTPFCFSMHENAT